MLVLWTHDENRCLRSFWTRSCQCFGHIHSTSVIRNLQTKDDVVRWMMNLFGGGWGGGWGGLITFVVDCKQKMMFFGG